MWIDFDGTVVVANKDQTMADISAILSNVTGMDVVVVDITTDANGKLTQVVVVVPGGESAANDAIASIKDAAASGGNDLLNRVVDAGLVVDVSSGTPTKRCTALLVVLVCALWRCLSWAV